MGSITESASPRYASMIWGNVRYISEAPNDGKSYARQSRNWAEITPNYSIQSLTGTSPTWNADNGINATISLSGNTTINFTNVEAGTSGNLTSVSAATGNTLSVTGYTNKISPAIFSATNQMLVSGNSKIDMYSWYYDGTYLVSSIV